MSAPSTALAAPAVHVGPRLRTLGMSPRRDLRRILASGAVLLVLAACGSSGSSGTAATTAPRATATTPTTSATPSTTTPAAGTDTAAVEVAVKGYAFGPATLSVKAGTKVTFVNGDGEFHTATSEPSAPAAFDTGNIDPTKPGGATITLTEPGTYAYVCAIHPNMTGTIVVT
jgi:plastocyanin